jgi:hypothetical protein
LIDEGSNLRQHCHQPNPLREENMAAKKRKAAKKAKKKTAAKKAKRSKKK